MSNSNFLGSYLSEKCLRKSILEKNGAKVNNKVNNDHRRNLRTLLKAFKASKAFRPSKVLGLGLKSEPGICVTNDNGKNKPNWRTGHSRGDGGIENLYRALKLFVKPRILAHTSCNQMPHFLPVRSPKNYRTPSDYGHLSKSNKISDLTSPTCFNCLGCLLVCWYCKTRLNPDRLLGPMILINFNAKLYRLVCWHLTLCLEVNFQTDPKLLKAKLTSNHLGGKRSYKSCKILQDSLNPFFSRYSNSRHLLAVNKLLMLQDGDLETNPGPESGAETGSRRDFTGQLRVTTYNVRGLNDEKKLRHLINYCYTTLGGKDKDSIYAFQETYIPQPGKIPYLWRGNFHLTPGEGNSSGCLTLMSPHISIVESKDLETRAHVLVCQKSGELVPNIIFANIYAPNPNTNEKIDFFERVFETVNEFIEKYDSKILMIAGDFNLIMKRNESKNRLFTAQERRVSDYLSNCAKAYCMSDLWETNPLFTWNRANSDSFSSIDRILFSAGSIAPTSVKVNWALSMSDHGAIEACFSYNATSNASKSKITRLDPSLLKCPGTAALIESELRDLLQQINPDWNPHLKLEFAKMSLRTVVERIQAEIKKRDKSEEDYLNEELNLAVNALENNSSPQDTVRLIDYVEELRAQKAELVETKGRRLAEKLGTKWYNDGEKSNKYFLRLLRRSSPDQFNCLESNGAQVVGEAEIEETIVDFYRDLYENYDKSQLNVVNDDEFFNNIESLSADDERTIVSPITAADLKSTLITCKDSCPGPDGIAYSYLLTFWNIFGNLIVEAWNYSLRTGVLPPSHKVSFLKLIPKVGKNLKQLTNWRPITLSNCDHKIITKTYASRLCARMDKVIKARQTAYLKNRLINDNIRAIIATVDTANVEENLDAILVSLDAKKAFDSVEHSYIRECLHRFGVPEFTKIFDILYSDLRSDIIINGKIVKGFKTLRGVKQGDALSCILFIMCMEPLLTNIESNVSIKSVTSVAANCELPKVYAYADDVNGLILNDQTSLKELFCEYERLTNKSGLQLNADKTEIMPFSSEGYVNQNFRITYLNEIHVVASKKEIKVNGILLQQDIDAMRDSNVAQVKQKIEDQLKTWSARHLTLLGKILLLKTYGISQIVFLMQSMTLNLCHFKNLNEILYRFLWNKRFLSAKAPERIKRDITNTPIKYGGLGMLNIIDLDESLKLRALGRLMITKHPFLSIIKNSINYEQFFFPSIKLGLDGVAVVGINLLMKDRQKLWNDPVIESNRRYVEILKGTKVKQILDQRGRSSIIYFNLRLGGKIRLGQLNRAEINSIKSFINASLYESLSRLVDVNILAPAVQTGDILFYKNRQYQLSKLSSKEIRVYRTPHEPICIYKLGCLATPTQVLTWGTQLKKVTSVKHRNLILRVAHGEIYTNLKLFRYGLKDNPRCPRCGAIESLTHKFLSCPYVDRIWKKTFELTNTIRTSIEPGEEISSQVLGLVNGTDSTLLTIHAEIMTRIYSLREDASYTLHPKKLIQMTLEFLGRREKNEVTKTKIADLLNKLLN